jgi:pyrroline-5-carboxylate reductase
MHRMRVAVVGCGRIAEALCAGMHRAGARELRAFDVCPARQREALARLPGATGCESVEEAVADADVMLLAVKPRDVAGALSAARDCLHRRTVVVSVAAGVPMEAMAARLRPAQSLVRAMPNVASAVRSAPAAATRSDPPRRRCAPGARCGAP